MSKRVKTLLIVLLVVVVLGGTLTALLLNPPAKEEEASSTPEVDESVQLVDKTSKDDDKTAVTVKKVEATVGKETFVISPNKEKALCVEKYKDLPISTEAIEALTNSLLDVRADKKVVDKAANPADFGLDKPKATYTVTYSDNTTVTLTVGNEEPLKTGYYFQISGKDAVYLMSSVDVYLKPSSGYIGTSMVTAPTPKEDDKNGQVQVTELELSGTARKQPVALHFRKNSESDEFQYSTHVITKPYRKGTSMNLGETFFSTITSLYASDVETAYPTKEQLKKYGLDKPYSVAKLQLAIVTTEEKDTSSKTDEDEQAINKYYNFRDYVIRLGGKNSEGQYYAMVDGVDVVYLVSPDSVQWAEKTYNDLADTMLFMMNIDTVGSISVDISGKKTTFNLTHFKANEDNTNETLEVKVDGKKYDTDNFRNLYQVMLAVTRSGEMTGKVTGSPEFTLTVNSLKGQALVVAKMYKYDANQYAVQLADGDTYLVKASVVENLINQINNYLAGKTVVVR